MIPQQFANTKGLSGHEIELYGRQMVLPEIGIDGQLKLRNSVVVLVGAGGLGSPAALYLAAAGVGHLRIVDGDTVALTNLHRQVIHDLGKIDKNKAESAVEECGKRNDSIKLEAIREFITLENGKKLLQDATVVVDATDNARSRYLINDVCAELHKPLVSGSALRWEGQLSVYNYSTERETGPCYRCIFPVPPPLNNTGACDMEGVAGVAPGIIGLMQAMEAIKVCIGLSSSVLWGRLIILDCLDPLRMWRCVKLRGQRPDCAACGRQTTIEMEPFVCPDEVYPDLPKENVIEPLEFFDDVLSIEEQDGNDPILKVRQESSSGVPQILVDVRKPNHFAVIQIEDSVSIPIDDFLAAFGMEDPPKMQGNCQKLYDILREKENSPKVYLICRRGRDAAKATVALLGLTEKLGKPVRCANVTGGFMKLCSVVPSLANFPAI